ncbi:MAG: trans-sulfuration enzyme family protein [Gemmatimonadales bacterium]
MNIDPADIKICTDAEEKELSYHSGVTPPIAQTALFTYPTFAELLGALASEHTHHVYTRGQNPTVELVEHKLQKLEHGEMCKCFASGMAAVSAIMLGLLEAGDHILFVNQIYGPTLELAQQLERFGIQHDTMLDLHPSEWEGAVRKETRLIWFESPGTMLFRTLNIAKLVEFAKSRNILTAMDNTWATPLLQKPLDSGVDLVMHACSKYIGGHSDAIAGAVVGSAELVEQIYYRAFMLNGGVLAPFDAWLLLRGLRTLPIRLREHGESGLAVARFLAEHEAVARVYHPALSGVDDGHRDGLRGYTGLFSFELSGGTFDDVVRVIDALKVFRIGVSWGGTESLAISPNRGDNAEYLSANDISPGLIRLSVGLEGANALIDDLGSALALL